MRRSLAIITLVVGTVTLAGCRSRTAAAKLRQAPSLSAALSFEDLDDETLLKLCFGKISIVFFGVAEKTGEYVFAENSSAFSQDFQKNLQQQTDEAAETYFARLKTAAADLATAVQNQPQACRRPAIKEAAQRLNLQPFSVFLGVVLDGPDDNDTTIKTAYFVDESGGRLVPAADASVGAWQMREDGALLPATGPAELHVASNLNRLGERLQNLSERAGSQHGANPTQQTMFFFKGHGGIYDSSPPPQAWGADAIALGKRRLGGQDRTMNARSSFHSVIFPDGHGAKGNPFAFAYFSPHWTRRTLCLELGKLLPYFQRTYCVPDGQPEGGATQGERNETQGPRGETQGERSETQSLLSGLTLDFPSATTQLQGAEKATMWRVPASFNFEPEVFDENVRLYSRADFEQKILPQLRGDGLPEAYRLTYAAPRLDDIALQFGSRDPSLVMLDTCYGDVNAPIMVAQNFKNLGGKKFQQVAIANPNALYADVVDYAAINAAQYRLLVSTVVDKSSGEEREAQAATKRYTEIVHAMNGPASVTASSDRLKGSRMQIGMTTCEPSAGNPEEPFCVRHATRNIFLFEDLVEYIDIFAETARLLAADPSKENMMRYSVAAAFLAHAESETNWWNQVPYKDPYGIEQVLDSSEPTAAFEEALIYQVYIRDQLQQVNGALAVLAKSAENRAFGDLLNGLISFLEQRENTDPDRLAGADELANQVNDSTFSLNERHAVPLNQARILLGQYLEALKRCAVGDCTVEKFEKVFPQVMLVKLQVFSQHLELAINCAAIEKLIREERDLRPSLRSMRSEFGHIVAAAFPQSEFKKSLVPRGHWEKYKKLYAKTDKLLQAAQLILSGIPEGDLKDMSDADVNQAVNAVMTYNKAIMTWVGDDLRAP